VSMTRRVWTAIPDGAVKDWLRLTVNNYVQRGSARFRRKNGAYITETADFTVVTAEPPFEVRRLVRQFELRHPLSAGQVVIDAGAFNGILMNIFAAQVGASGRVIALEPDVINRKRALHNWQLNGRPAHVHLIPKALWDYETEIEFCERGALGSSAFWDGPGGHKVKIRTTTLDQVVAESNLAKVNFVKMNIEGAEIKALEGATNTMRYFKPHFAISSDHFVSGDMEAGERTCGRVEKILREHGYAAETVKFGSEWVTYGTPLT
jgi:FkbM family methyltransferase